MDNQCNSEDECRDTYFPALSQYKDDFFTGQCQSSDGNRYSGVQIRGPLLTENSPEACALFCLQSSLNNGFQVGMQFGNDKCLCLYDGSELPPSSLLPDYTEERIRRGEGPVASGSTRAGWRCYPLEDVTVDVHSLNEPKYE